jgi:hypothetical protein
MTKEGGISFARWPTWLLVLALLFAAGCFAISRSRGIGQAIVTFAEAQPSALSRDQRCQANHDGKVDAKDVAMLSAFWQGFPDPLADCNSDGQIDLRDAGILMNRWTQASAGVTLTQASSETPKFSIAFSKEPGSWQPQDHVVALVQLDSRVDIAAAEVTLVYPADALSVVHVHTAPTAFPVWFQRPSLSTPGRLGFAVGHPGGFSGKGTLVALDLLVTDPAKARLMFGLGTSAVSYEAEGTRLEVLHDAVAEPATADALAPFLLPDTDSPAEVKAYTYRMAASFGDRFIVVLQSADMGSGVVDQEVEERGVRTAITSDAYVLRSNDQGDHRLRVVTRDGFGNARETDVSIFIP